jgi:hypothetical protein
MVGEWAIGKGVAPMEPPIVFVTTHRIKDGKLEQFEKQNRAVADHIEETTPDTLAFLTYLNQEGSEVRIVHVFPDAQAMDRRHGPESPFASRRITSVVTSGSSRTEPDRFRPLQTVGDHL